MADDGCASSANHVQLARMVGLDRRARPLLLLPSTRTSTDSAMCGPAGIIVALAEELF